MFMGEKGRVKQKILKKRMGVKWRDDVEGNETSMSVIFAQFNFWNMLIVYVFTKQNKISENGRKWSLPLKAS